MNVAAAQSVAALRATAPLELDRIESLLAEHLNAAVQSLGPSALGVIDLPPLTAGALVPEQIRIAAVLLWARYVELAGLPRLVEELATALVRGRAELVQGEGAERLIEYFRRRSERFSPEERQAIYAQVLGVPATPDGAAIPELDALAAALAEIGAAPAGRSVSHLEARACVIAADLATGLSERSAGIAGFAASDIVAHIREALELLGERAIADALGGGGPWRIVRVHAPALLGHAVDPGPALARASAGEAMVSWLAAHAAELEAGRVAIDRSDEVVYAAQRWLAEEGAA